MRLCVGIQRGHGLLRREEVSLRGAQPGCAAGDPHVRGGANVPIPLRSRDEPTGDEVALGTWATDHLEDDGTSTARDTAAVLEEQEAMPEEKT